MRKVGETGGRSAILCLVRRDRDCHSLRVRVARRRRRLRGHTSEAEDDDGGKNAQHDDDDEQFDESKASNFTAFGREIGPAPPCHPFPVHVRILRLTVLVLKRSLHLAHLPN